jgi:dihydrofolate synthase / folylpolyglutamate synthase
LNYQQAIDRLLTLVDHERAQPVLPRQKRIYDLGRIAALLEHLGNPHRSAPTIHVAGTKGKGSVSALCDAALHAAGYRTGFYSSPHLHSFCERIRRNARPISQEQFAGLVEELWPQQQWVKEETDLGPVSLFEYMTAMAFQCFAGDSVDFQTIEVGLGGRLDATNVVDSSVCVITSISLDHTAILGDTLAQIASEKAGIIKPGSAVVVAPQPAEALETIISVCRERAVAPVLVGSDVTWERGRSDLSGQSMLIRGRRGEYELSIPLLGTHQLENAASAVAALECLQDRGHRVPGEAIARGFAGTFWPCRMEVLGGSPLVMADGAHNAYSMAALLGSLQKYVDYQRLVVVAGFSRDKSVQDMVRLLAAQKPLVYVTRSRHPRSVPPEDLADLFRAEGVFDVVETHSTAEATRQAQEAAHPGDLVLATGSLFVAAEAREALLGIEPELYPDLLPPDLRAPRPAV